MNRVENNIEINYAEPELVLEIRAQLRANKEAYGKSYCPCVIEHTDDSVCPCKDFRTNIDLKRCHCGLFIRK